MLLFWSKTQAVVAMSSAEAELGAAVKASLEVLGMMSLWKDVGEATRGHVSGDASAAIGITRRMGLGKGKTLEHELVVGPSEGSITCNAVPQRLALICSPRRLTMTVSCDTQRNWR